MAPGISHRPGRPRIFDALIAACHGMREAAESAGRGERIAKFLARAGVASRRDAEALIAARARCG